tara:strand:+ start:2719 stop:2922 length:204 start_codon:yes stop_codon:yes gene_type:complete
MEERNRVAEIFESMHTNHLRDLALNVILLENDDVNKSLFEYIQFMGDFELLGEVTRLTMKQEAVSNE